jgi:isocitrate dehydrogenase
MTTGKPKIVYTNTDEAPALATQSLLPIIKAFTDTCGVDVELKDIFVSGKNFSGFSRLFYRRKYPAG